MINPHLLPIENEYLDLCSDVFHYGQKKNLYGSDNQFIFSQLGAILRHSFNDGFPVYSSKKVLWKTAIKEMLWFLTGNNDPKWLIDNNVHIWDDWIYKAYCEEFPEFPIEKSEYLRCLKEEPEKIDLPSIVRLHYGNITNWFVDIGKSLNQTEWVLENLPKAPYRKSYLISLWDPAVVYQQADICGFESVVLPACHFAHQLVSNGPGKLSLIVDIRSNDLFLGNPLAN